MEIFFTPELYTANIQILNVVDDKKQPVGYFAFVMDESKKIYVYGHLENEGVGEDYKGMVTYYLDGLSKLHAEAEVFSYIAVGGKKIELNKEKE